MATVKLGGVEIQTVGELPAIGSNAPHFTLTDEDLFDVAPLEDFSGQALVLNIFPSIDTAVGAESTRRFNAAASARDDVIVFCIAADLPFALLRFRDTEKLHDVEFLSAFRHPEFGYDYGIRIEEGRLEGLLSRAVVVIDDAGIVQHTELTPEIGWEPDYDAALSSLDSLKSTT